MPIAWLGGVSVLVLKVLALFLAFFFSSFNFFLLFFKFFFS